MCTMVATPTSTPRTCGREFWKCLPSERVTLKDGKTMFHWKCSRGNGAWVKTLHKSPRQKSLIPAATVCCRGNLSTVGCPKESWCWVSASKRSPHPGDRPEGWACWRTPRGLIDRAAASSEALPVWSLSKLSLVYGSYGAKHHKHNCRCYSQILINGILQ